MMFVSISVMTIIRTVGALQIPSAFAQTTKNTDRSGSDSGSGSLGGGSTTTGSTNTAFTGQNGGIGERVKMV
jgi:hypothetical protein